MSATTASPEPEKGLTFNVMRPSQHGEEERVLAEDFDTRAEAEAWIDRNEDTHPYLPYVEEA